MVSPHHICLISLYLIFHPVALQALRIQGSCQFRGPFRVVHISSACYHVSLSLSPIVCVCPSLLFVWGLSSFQVSMVERRSCGSGSIYQATPKAAQHPPGSVLLTYVFNNLHASLFLSSEFVDIVLSFSLSIVYTWHLLHLSILGEGSLVCCADCKAPCGKLWFWAL